MKMRKLFAGLAAAATLLSGLALGAGTANADEPATADQITFGTSITLTGTADQLQNSKSYHVLKVAGFSAEADGTVKITTELSLLDTVKGLDPVKAGYTGTATAYGDPIAWLSTQSEADWRTFANALADTSNATGADVKEGTYTAPTSEGGTDGKLVFDNSKLSGAGLYLLTDANTTTAEGVTKSLPILVGTKIGNGTSPLANATGEVAIKNQTVPLQKKIEKGDTLVDQDDKNIGDTVNYRITTSIPDTSKYEWETTDTNGVKQQYKFSLGDVLSKGQQYVNDSLKVYVVADGSNPSDANKIDAGSGENANYTVQTNGQATDENGTTITIDLSKYVFTAGKSADAGQGKQIIIRYSATLTKDATVNGNDSNPNTVTLTYSSNPFANEQHGTIDHGTHVYTHSFGFTKVDADGKDLAGASFKIARNGADDAKTYLTYNSTNNQWSNAQDKDSATTFGGAADSNNPQANQSSFTFSGLAAGTYTVEETAVPTGYLNALASFEVKIDENGGVTFKGTDTYGLAGNHGDTFKAAPKGVYKVTNVRSITQLPLTGAAGVALFAVLALLLASAGAVVSFKSRSAKRALNA